MSNVKFSPGFSRQCDEKKLRTGFMGSYNGVGNHSIDVYQSRRVPDGRMYFTGETSASGENTNDGIYAGYVADTIPLHVLSADRPDLEQIGFRISEEIGFALNPVAVQRVVVPSTEPAIELPVEEGDELDSIVGKFYPWANVEKV